MALSSSTHTTAYRFGRTQPTPSVNSRTIYQFARKYARKGHSRSPTGSSYYILLSTRLIEPEHPVGMNYALLRVNLAVATFGVSNSTRLLTRWRHIVKIRTLQFNWENPLCKEFNLWIKRLKKSWTRLNRNDHELDCLPDWRKAILSARRQPWPHCFEYAHVWF